MEQNGVALIAPDIIAKLQILQESLPKDKQLSWLTLCNGKSVILNELTKKELELQQLLLNYDTMDVLKLQEALELYKAGAKQMPEIRKGFTRYLDKIGDELMLPEKRVATWEVATKANAKYLQLRLDKEKADEEVKAKQFELQRFIAHVKNEYIRLFSEYKLAINKTITDAYLMALKDNLDEAGVKKYLETTASCLRDLKPGQPVKFAWSLNTKEEILAAYKTVQAPDYETELKHSVPVLIDHFKMYFNDKENAQKASEFALQQEAQKKVDIETESQNAISVNNLLANSSATTIVESDGVKSIKRKNVIDTKNLTQQGCLAIIAAFVSNWSSVIEHVRVKSWENLKVDQMSSALDSAEIKVQNVTYKEEVK